LRDYWRQLSAKSSIVVCRTANPTSFLRPVVGSASLLSGTAIFWRLAISVMTCLIRLHPQPPQSTAGHRSNYVATKAPGSPCGHAARCASEQYIDLDRLEMYSMADLTAEKALRSCSGSGAPGPDRKSPAGKAPQRRLQKRSPPRPVRLIY